MSRASKKPPSQARGFTLLEVLVALAVFAVVGAVAYRGLDRVSTNKAHLDREMHFWRELGQVMDRMEGDLVQIAPRSDLLASGLLRPPLRSASQPGDALLSLTRFDGKREPVQVSYRLREQKLELLMGSASAPKAYPLLENVTACRFSFLDSSGVWLPQWSGKSGQGRPQGIRLQLELAGRGEFERVFALP